MAPVHARSLAFRTDLMVLRLAGAEVEDRGDHLVVRTPLNPYFYWGNFILLSGTAPVQDASRWLRTFRRAFPVARHVAIGWDRGSERCSSRLRPLIQAGLELTVDQVLLAKTLTSPRLPPPEIVVRPLAGEDDWEGQGRLTAACWSGAGSQEFQSARQADFRRLEATGRAVFFGAFRRGELVSRRLEATGRAVFFGAFRRGELVSGCGIVSGRGGTARFQHVQTHPEHRRRGLAAAVLLTASRHAAAHLSARRLVIVAEPGGPALPLYRELGFRPAGSQLQLTAAPVAEPTTPG